MIRSALMKRAIIGNDHGAVALKFRIMNFLAKKGYEVLNMGVDTEDSVDYPDIAAKVCGEFKKGGFEFGILCCGTGIGISISANKIEGILCALPQNIYAAEMAKAHNNVNFLAFGGRIEYADSVEAMIGKYIDTPFAGGRHERRVEKMFALDHSGNN
jgi:ribose 5-phosphate isomerase B